MSEIEYLQMALQWAGAIPRVWRSELWKVCGKVVRWAVDTVAR